MAGAGVMAKQEQDRALDKPISTPDPAAGSPRPGTAEPAEPRRQGAMGERRVSESPPEARLLPLRVSEGAGGIAGTARSRPGFRSSQAIAGAPLTPSTATPMHPGLPGGADRPPGSAEQVEDFLTAYSRLRDLKKHHLDQPGSKIIADIRAAEECLRRFVKRRFEQFGGDFKRLARYPGHFAKVEHAYMGLQEKARKADNDGNRERTSWIRYALFEIDGHVASKLKNLCDTHGLAAPSSTPAATQTPATAAPTFDWCTAYRQMLGICKYLIDTGHFSDAHQFQKSVRQIGQHVKVRFHKYGGKREQLLPLHAGHPSRPEQMYRILEEKARRSEAPSPGKKAADLRLDMTIVTKRAQEKLSLLTRVYGPLEDLATRAGLTERQAPATVGSTATSATVRVAVAPPLQPVDPVPAPGSVTVPPPPAPRRPETGSAELQSLAALYSEPPGPSYRVRPARAPRTPTAPAREVPPAQRKAIVERFRSGEALLYARLQLGRSSADALGWADVRKQRVLDDLRRLHSSAREDPAAAAALADIDWSGIEVLMAIMGLASPSP